jgi:flagellar biosynthesis protein FlhF
MHIKKFEASELKKALEQIRSELGEDALILETRNRPNGRIEVLAAHPHSASPEPVPAPKSGTTSVSAHVADILSRLPEEQVQAALGNSAYARHVGATRGPASSREKPTSAETLISAQAAANQPPRENVSTGAPAQSPASIEPSDSPAPSYPRSAGRLRSAIAGSRQSESSKAELEQELETVRARANYLGRLVRSEHFSLIPLPLRDLYLDLSEAGLDANLLFELLTRMGDAPLGGDFSAVAPEVLVTQLSKFMQVGGAVKADDARRVVALVGPTGVGKTTTLDKIAGQAAFEMKKSVALLSTDSYRVFGAQHLQAYAGLMNLPFAIARTREEIRERLEGDFADVDLVLIDTSGRSPRDPDGVAEIHRILGACPEVDIHLVLAANGKIGDLALALDSFLGLPVRHLVFTKLDEATRIGGLFSLALKARRPISYLGIGQEVPDDIEIASIPRLSEDLLIELSEAKS